MRAMVAGLGACALGMVLVGCDLRGPEVRLGRVPGLDVAAGDVDGDGDEDLVSVGWYASTQDGAVVWPEYTVLRNDGPGRFAPVDGPDDHDVTTNTRQVALGDLDGDGSPDLVRVLEHVVGCCYDDDLAINLGDGAGGFSPQTIVTDAVSVDDAGGLATGDVDGDGHLDVVMSGDTTVNVYRGDGTGAVADPLVIAAPPELINLDDVTLTDLDGDGDTDMVLAATVCEPVPPGQIPNCGDEFVTAPALLVLRGDGSGTGWAPEPVTISVGWDSGDYGRDLAVGDLNDDGRPDVVTGFGPLVVVAAGQPDGSFARLPVAQPDFGGCGPLEVAMTDIERDGDLDVALAGSCGKGAVLLGDGAGGFPTNRPLSFPADGDTVDPATELLAHDLNGDGRPDLAVTLSAPCPCGPDLDPGVAVIFNRLG